MLTVRLWLRDGWIRRIAATIAILDLVFIVGMVVFIHYWAEIHRFGPAGYTFIRFVLVQFHLGTENVVAAWYSSMLLLAVGAASCAAFAIERRTPRSGLDRWLGLGWLVFAAIFTLLSLDEVGSFHERIGMMVSLNKASLQPSSKGPVGWVYMLAVPIVAVGAFMLAFGWMRLRRVPAAFVLLAMGVGLYLSDPLLEALEAVLVRSGSPRIVVERVLEEGVAELGGTLCFLLGVLIYCSRTGGTRPLEWRVSRRIAALTILAAGALLTIGVPIAHWVVARLPPGDTGIPDNWFPAAALALLALILILVQGRTAVPAAAACVIASAYFGAGLYVYAAWFPLMRQNGVLVDITATFLVTMAAGWVTLRSTQSAGVIRSVPSP